MAKQKAKQGLAALVILGSLCGCNTVVKYKDLEYTYSPLQQKALEIHAEFTSGTLNSLDLIANGNSDPMVKAINTISTLAVQGAK